MNEGLPVGKLKPLVRGERSNLRRAIRTLMRRELAEEVVVGDERVIRLTFWGVMAMMPLPEPVDPRAELKARKAKWAEEARQRALERERARQERAEALARHRRRRPLTRRRSLGPVQMRILSVLRQGIDGEFRALETTYLKSLVGGDRSNLRRAIFGLLERGYIVERTVDGRRYYELTLWGYSFAVPLDPNTAPMLSDPP